MANNVTYSFGWIPSKPDIRDRYYRYVAPPRMAYPPAFSLNEPPLGTPFNPPFDQGALGSCGPNSLCGNLTYDEMQDPAPDVMPSRMFSYYVAREEMGTTGYDSGVDNRSMLKSCGKKGFCDEDKCPYDVSKFTQKPSQAAYDQAATRAGGIVYQSVPQDIGTMKSVLFDLKRPIIFGFSVYDSMLTDAVARTGDIPMPSAFDHVAGGHDVLLVGWNDLDQRFILRNSWGSWGKGGYGTVPYDYAIDADLAGDFWSVTKVPDLSPIPVPPGPTPPGPTPIGQIIKAIVDQIFAKLIAGTNSLAIKMILSYVQKIFDQLLDTWPFSDKMQATVTRGITGAELKVIVDQLFTWAISMAPNLLVRWAIRLVQQMVDAWLDAHPGPIGG